MNHHMLAAAEGGEGGPKAGRHYVVTYSLFSFGPAMRPAMFLGFWSLPTVFQIWPSCVFLVLGLNYAFSDSAQP